MRRKLSQVAASVGGTLHGDDVMVEGVATDSRDVERGNLFVAIAGEQVDGHAFVDQAMNHGAVAALVSRETAGASILVEDTRDALMNLTRDERAVMGAKVVGITGSTGKTSVKDLTSSVLASRFRVWSSPRSFNTEVGVPLTILNAPSGTEVVVVEMGSRGIGHIARLCEIAEPHIGVVTNVGPAHMEMFGSLQNVATAKGELVEALPPDGVAVLNADDPLVDAFESRSRAGVIRFGVSPHADVRGDDVVLDELGRPSFTLVAPDGSERMELPVPGEHMAWNALAAAAAGIALGLSVGECASGLKDVRLSPWRMELQDGAGGVRILNDAYNANPTSMAAALKAARWMAKGGRSIAVLGEMAELGEISAAEHERIGEIVARLGIDHLVVIGPRAFGIAIGAEREGVEPERIRRVETTDEAARVVRDIATEGDVVLVKGSRVAGLERVAEALS
ncbi:MAG: UDP-N-acetylmuramoyl-tripeptide--D-alanyl-D-alanine ligase [Actinomycetota bacterium]